MVPDLWINMSDVCLMNAVETDAAVEVVLG